MQNNAYCGLKHSNVYQNFKKKSTPKYANIHTNTYKDIKYCTQFTPKYGTLFYFTIWWEKCVKSPQKC